MMENGTAKLLRMAKKILFIISFLLFFSIGFLLYNECAFKKEKEQNYYFYEYNKTVWEYNLLVERYNNLSNITYFKLNEEIMFYQKELTSIKNYTWTGCKSKMKPVKFCKNCDYWIGCESNSMSPTFDCNNVLYFCRVSNNNEYHIGDIVYYANRRYFDSDSDFIIHRIINITSSGVITKGDNNFFDDGVIVPFDAVKGKLYQING